MAKLKLPSHAERKPNLDGTRTSFPLQILPAKLQRFVKVAAASAGVPQDLVAMPLLTVASAAIGSARMVQVKPSWKEPATLFTCLVGASGTGKSPAVSLVVDPLKAEQRRLYEEFMACIDGDEDPEQEAPALIVTDSTIEAIDRCLALNPRGLLLNVDEMVGWLRRLNSGTATPARQRYLSVWSMEPIHIRRIKKGRFRRIKKGRSLTIPSPALSILGGIQPEVLRRCKLQQDEDGLLQRLLLIYPEDQSFSGWSDAKLTSRLKTEWEEVYQGLHAIGPQSMSAEGSHVPKIIFLDVPARETFKTFCNNLKHLIDSGH